jgi:hypothetical protein
MTALALELLHLHRSRPADHLYADGFEDRHQLVAIADGGGDRRANQLNNLENGFAVTKNRTKIVLQPAFSGQKRA